ncbi:hypothetical protein ACU70A_12260 [Syntrophomonas erecta subsp. sporosyntropha]
MSQLIGLAMTKQQAASALTDLYNRGYNMKADIMTTESLGNTHKDRYIISLYCDEQTIYHIKEHLVELHGIENIKIVK